MAETPQYTLPGFVTSRTRGVSGSFASRLNALNKQLGLSMGPSKQLGNSSQQWTPIGNKKKNIRQLYNGMVVHKGKVVPPYKPFTPPKPNTASTRRMKAAVGATRAVHFLSKGIS